MKAQSSALRWTIVQVAVLLPLVIGIGLACWIETRRQEATQRSALLLDARSRMDMDLLKVNDALQAVLIEPKNEAERKRAREAVYDLSAAIDVLQTEFPGNPDLIAAAKNLQSLHRRILDQADAESSGALSVYRKNYGSLESQREQLADDLDRQVGKAMTAQALASRQANRLATGGIIAALLLGAAALWFQSYAVSKPLGRLNEALDRMQRGDFTRRVDLDGSAQFRSVGEGLNRLTADLASLVSQVHRSGIQVNATATQIAATAKEQQTTAHEIAATTAEIGTASREISTTSRELVKTIDEVSHVAEQATHLGSSGQTAIAQMEATMRQIMDASGAITAKLAVLSEKTANINSVVTTITRVADQTNLLSLNAAIEAEKAGEYGLGFAVVAMEIRRLADQTAVATYDIEKTVKEMQSAAAAGVMGMDKFSEEVRRGVDEIRQVSAHLAEIIHQVQALTPRFQTVNEGMHAQAAGAQQISETLAQLSEAARQTAESLRQSNLAIEQLNEAARGLQSGVGRFKMER
jgi:methyl-accepting chemotaxis protein WspA